MKTYFIVKDGNVLECVKIGQYTFCPKFEVFEFSAETFDTREDALFSKFLEAIKRGKPIKNYRTSKYYKMYIERLEKDYPEFMI